MPLSLFLLFCCSVVRDISDLWKKTDRCRFVAPDNIERRSINPLIGTFAKLLNLLFEFYK